MSPRASRFFGCVLPAALAFFGCGSCLMLGSAGQIFFQVIEVEDGAMAPLVPQGAQVLSDNTAFWSDVPSRHRLVSVIRPDGPKLRYVVAVPGDTVEGRGGQVYVNDAPCDGRSRDPRGRACGLGTIWSGEPVDDFAAHALGADEYWVMATQRSGEDSRAWGPLHRSDLYGEVLLRRNGATSFTSIDLPSIGGEAQP